ncbi:MAG: hypothetical protein Fur0039_16850 [Rhodocyclaceae bacterium]
MKAIGFLVALLASGAACAQQMYRWVEKDGRVVYSDQAPPATVREVRSLRPGRPGVIESTPSYALQKAQQDFPVTFYRGIECDTACADARAVLQKRAIPFQEVTLGGEEENAAFRKTFGSKDVSVPSILVGSQKQIGFEAGLWNRMLDEAGYPRSGASASPAGPARAGAQPVGAAGGGGGAQYPSAR